MAARRFNAEEIAEIRAQRLDGATTVSLAAKYGVKQPVISNICNGRTYRDVAHPRGTAPRTAREVAADKRRALAPQVERMIREGKSLRAIARELEVSLNFIVRVYRQECLAPAIKTLLATGLSKMDVAVKLGLSADLVEKLVQKYNLEG